MLIFSELYDNGWGIYYANGQKIDENRHYLVNTYANGWLVDKKGNYELIVKYEPQKLLEISKQASLITVVAGVLYIFYSAWKSKK